MLRRCFVGASALLALISSPVLAGEPLAGTLVPDPLATNGGTFTLVITSADACPDACPTATGDLFLTADSTLDVTFDRNTTELTIEGGYLGIENFQLSFPAGATLKVSDASVSTNPAAEPPSAPVGANSGEFDLMLDGLTNATVQFLFFPPLTFVDQEGKVGVVGDFAFDPELGTFAMTNVGGVIEDQTFQIGDTKFALSGVFELNFVASGILDIFGEAFENGDFGGWSEVVQSP